MVASDIFEGKAVSDSLIIFEGKELSYLGSGRSKERSFSIYPYNGQPMHTSSKKPKIEAIDTIPIYVYYDSALDRRPRSYLDSLFDSANRMFRSFHLGFAFQIQEVITFDDYELTHGHADNLFTELSKANILKPDINWHLFLFDSENYISGSAAFYVKGYDHNMIFSDYFLYHNPIVLAHEILHGFPGHVDLELSDNIFDDAEAVAQNIMYNYDMPKAPRYSLFQNSLASGIPISKNLGINIFPLEVKDHILGNLHFNSSPASKGESLLTHSVSSHPQHEYNLYLVDRNAGLEKYPELTNMPENWISEMDVIYRRIISSKAFPDFSIEEKYLGIFGYHPSDYAHNRQALHLQHKIKKLIWWYVELEFISQKENLTFLHSLSEVEYDYYMKVKRHKGTNQLEGLI